MITWIALKIGLSEFIVKLTLAGLLLVGILYGLRLWGNKQWYKGEAQGRLTVAADIEKRKQAEWKTRELALKQSAADLANEKATVSAAADQLAQDRMTLSKTLSSSLAAIQAERVRLYASAAAVPDNRIWDDIRAISRQLATDPR
jgi:hypothetical protein